MGISGARSRRSHRLSVLVGVLALLAVAGTAGCSFSRLFTPDYYRVERGDTLYSIAWRYDLDWRDVARWNDLSPPYKIRPGQTLVLDRYAPVAYPQADNTAASPPPAKDKPAVDRQPTRQATRQPTQQQRSRKPASARQSSPPTATDNWRWPTDGPIVRGYKRAGTRQGIDIGGAIGDPIKAAAGGRVVYSGTGLKGYGNLIIIKHDERYLSAYGFNRRLLVKQGERVKAGQAVAEMGLGPGQKPTLHLEIRRDGRPVDPTGVLPRR